MENDKQSAQLELGGQRILTVSSLYRQWGEGYHKKECLVPSIRLNGKWLAAFGLAAGQKVRVTTDGSTITIRPIGRDSRHSYRK